MARVPARDRTQTRGPVRRKLSQYEKSASLRSTRAASCSFWISARSALNRGFGVGSAPQRVRRNEEKLDAPAAATYPATLAGAGSARPAHILGGWSPSTPRFPKKHWEIVKIHDFSLKLIDFHGKSMKNHGSPRFPNGSWEIWVSKVTTPPRCVQA